MTEAPLAKGDCMTTILNTDRLQAAGPIRPPRSDDFSPPRAPRADAGTAQPEEPVPQNSALWSALSPASSELAVWRLIWRLHNKERARELNPLTSANRPPRDNDPHGPRLHAEGPRGPGLWAPCGAGRFPVPWAPNRVRQRRKLQSRRGTAAQGDACGSVNCKNRRMTRPTNARVSS